MAGLGRCVSIVGWVGLGWVKKNGPTSISEAVHTIELHGIAALCDRQIITVPFIAFD